MGAPQTNLTLKKTKTLQEKMPQVNRSSEKFFDIWELNKENKKGNKKWLEARFRSDINKRISFYERVFFPFWDQAIRDYSLDTSKRAVELKKKKRDYLTNEKQPIIRTYVDRLLQAIFKTQFFIKVYPLTANKEKKAKSVQRLIEWCFGSSKAKKSLYDMARSAILNGPGFVRTGFTTPKEVITDIKDTETDSLFNVDDFYAQFERVSEFSIFGEPHIPFYEQRDLIYRKILPMKTILKKLGALNIKLSEDHIKYMVDKPYPFTTKNFEKIRLVKYYSRVGSNPQDEDFNNDNRLNLTFDNKNSEYVEYRLEDNLCIYVNGYLVFDGPNPLNIHTDIPKRVHPFKWIGFTREPGVWVSDGVGPLLAGQQRLYDTLYNISFDLLKFAAGPMFLLQPGQSIEGNEKLLKYEPFTFKQVRGPGKIETLELPKPAPEVSKAMSDILEMANFMIAPSMYNQLQGVSRSATDSAFRSEGLRDSIIGLVESMNEMLNATAEEWLYDIKKKMPARFKIPVFGSSKLEQAWEKIDVEDLQGKYIFERDSESIKDINKTVERAQLSELTNFLKQFGQDPTTGKRLVDNEKLVAEGLELFNKDPDILLNDKEYKAKVEEAQKQAMNIQKELSEFHNSISPQPPQQEQQVASRQGGLGGPAMQMATGQRAAPQVMEQPGSNLESNTGGAAEANGDMGVASIMKKVAE